VLWRCCWRFRDPRPRPAPTIPPISGFRAPTAPSGSTGGPTGLLARLADRALRDPGAQRHGVPGQLAGAEPARREAPTAGQMDFRHTDAGLLNTNYQSTQPPPQFPVLCASASECGNSVVGALYCSCGARGPRPRRAAPARYPLELDGRRGQRRRQRQPLHGPREGRRSRLPGRRAGRGSGIRRQPGRRPRRSFRQRRPDGHGSAASVPPGSCSATPAGRRAPRNWSRRTCGPGRFPRGQPAPLNRGQSAVFRWNNDRHMRTWSRSRSTSARSSTTPRGSTSRACPVRSRCRAATRSRPGWTGSRTSRPSRARPRASSSRPSGRGALRATSGGDF
jgi:hypothetical protein